MSRLKLPVKLLGDDHLLERRALDELERHERGVLEELKREDRDDVGMPQPREALGLAQQRALAELAIEVPRLDGDPALKLRIESPIDRAHAASAELLAEQVLTELFGRLHLR